MTERMEAVEGNLIVLQQAVDVLRRMDDTTYATGGVAPGVSAIGVHFRHVLDHYRALLTGLATDEIDYDARPRHVPLETDRELAIATALGFATDLARLPWIEATVRFGDAPIAEPDRKRLADRLHQAVSARFIPVVLEPE